MRLWPARRRRRPEWRDPSGRASPLPAGGPRRTRARAGERQGARRRHVSGDLTGLASVKFDTPSSPTRRFRLVYGGIDAETRGVLAIGVRDEHAIYRPAVERIRAQEEPGPA